MYFIVLIFLWLPIILKETGKKRLDPPTEKYVLTETELFAPPQTPS